MKHMKTALFGTFGALAIPAAIAIKGIDIDVNVFKNAINELSGNTQKTAELLHPQNTKKALEIYQEPSQ